MAAATLTREVMEEAPCLGYRFPVWFLADNLEARRTCILPPFHAIAQESSFLRKKYVKSAWTAGAARVAAPMLGFSKGNRRQKRPGPDSYGIIPSKFDPRKVSGISRIAVVNSGCKHARAHAVRMWILSTRDCFSKRVLQVLYFTGVNYHIVNSSFRDTLP